MSQDLLAAFGEAPTGQVASQSYAHQQGNNQKKRSDGFWDYSEEDNVSAESHWNAASAEPDEDDFGDFEDASPSSAQLPAAAAAAVRSPAPGERSTQRTRARSPPKASSFPPKGPPAKKPLPFSPRPENTGEKVGRHPFADHMDLLFDAGADDYDAGADELGDLATNPEAAMAYSKRLIAEQEAASTRRPPPPSTKAASPLTEKQGPPEPTSRNALATPPERTIAGARRQSPKRKERNANVLFDADDVSSGTESGRDDDWGDFEESQSQHPSSKQTQPAGSSFYEVPEPMPAVDLLALDAQPSASYFSTKDLIQKARPNQLDHTLQGAGHQTQFQSQIDEVWDDFETTSSPPQPLPVRNQVTPSSQSSNAPSRLQDQLPPTNIPPPAHLLSLFPGIFAAADDAVFSTLSKLPAEQKSLLLNHPATFQYLLTYLNDCTALAYIIAGRKLRWKRDQRLAQSMRIGPAAAGGGKGGMKLVGIDRSEAAKEDREVLDTVHLYRAQMGKLQSAAASAGAGGSAPGGPPSAPKLPAVPNLSDSMPARALKPAEGGLTAPRPCALCGLKREERVAKVDRDIEDSFGEWWIEGVGMHVVCQDFWIRQGVKLGRG